MGEAIEIPGFTGEFFTDSAMRTLYATDASMYQEMPLAVAVPKTEKDISKLIEYANKHGVGIIPRVTQLA